MTLLFLENLFARYDGPVPAPCRAGDTDKAARSRLWRRLGTETRHALARRRQALSGRTAPHDPWLSRLVADHALYRRRLAET